MKIPLTQGKCVLIDKKDFPLISSYSWDFNGRYARTRIHGKTIYMHRMILNALKGVEVDHVNRDRLDNRRINLRVANRKINILNRGINKNNTSGYKGVSKAKDKWTAHIVVNYKAINLGYFQTKEKAAHVYNQAASKYFGDYAYQNSL